MSVFNHPPASRHRSAGFQRRITTGAADDGKHGGERLRRFQSLSETSEATSEV